MLSEREVKQLLLDVHDRKVKVEDATTIIISDYRKIWRMDLIRKKSVRRKKALRALNDAYAVLEKAFRLAVQQNIMDHDKHQRQIQTLKKNTG